MRAPVYRNLDKPFEILGFNALELTLLCFAFVAGGELSALMNIHRVWAFLLTLLAAAGLFLMRRHLGDLFLVRLIRFVQLPRRVYSKLILSRTK